MAGKRKQGALVLRAGATPRKVVRRPGDWSQATIDRFVETLAETCNVTLAAQAIKRSVSSVYHRRSRDAALRRAWAQALVIGYSRLEMMLLERALHGVEKVITARDGTSTVMRDYGDRTALTLLRMHRDAVAATEEGVSEQDHAEARDRILARIERLRAKQAVGCAGRQGRGPQVKSSWRVEAVLRVMRGVPRAGQAD